MTSHFLTERPIDVERLIERVVSDARGGVAVFLGTVRNHHAGREVERLEYSAYSPMAEAECARIAAEAERTWGCAVALEHRVGALGIGDVSVAVAAAAPHRDEAFAACRYVIDEMKRRVPVWKREYYTDGTVAWVDPTAPGGVHLSEGTPDAVDF
ncbi:MAG: molybdenum cofactor biosynthesis protein MoaE [Gemmatimonadota bacterium]